MDDFVRGQLVRLLQFFGVSWKSPVSQVGGAHAPSPDVRGCHRGIRSLDAGRTPGILSSLAANAGSRGMGTPSRDRIQS